MPKSSYEVNQCKLIQTFRKVFIRLPPDVVVPLNPKNSLGLELSLDEIYLSA